MTDSAISPGGASTRAREISRAAQELVAERGWAHVTVDDIAAHVGISRRTFFNHVDSKESAVLGALPRLDDEHRRRLREEPLAEGTDLLDLAVQIGTSVVSAREAKIEHFRRLHDVLVANPELIPRFKDRVESLFAEIVGQLTTRPDVDAEQARVTLVAAAGIFQLSVEDALDRPELGAFSARLETNLALLRETAGPPRR